MCKVSITKEFSWNMAHLLAGHEGLCKNLHGHTYKMQIEVTRKTEDVITSDASSQGMVIDFKDLKQLVNVKIVEPLDHAFMYWINSPDKVEQEIGEILIKNGRKVARVNYRTTAEEMAMNFFSVLTKDLLKINIELKAVRVWETPTSFAEVRGEII
jgi:6-pyruvoyltetrahydropterin/6-carboxytetrahydropterin synthase